MTVGIVKLDRIAGRSRAGKISRLLGSAGFTFFDGRQNWEVVLPVRRIDGKSSPKTGAGSLSNGAE